MWKYFPLAFLLFSLSIHKYTTLRAFSFVCISNAMHLSAGCKWPRWEKAREVLKKTTTRPRIVRSSHYKCKGFFKKKLCENFLPCWHIILVWIFIFRPFFYEIKQIWTTTYFSTKYVFWTFSQEKVFTNFR